MYEIKQLILQDCINLIKNPMWLFFTTLFPFLLVSIMGYLCLDMYGKEVTSYDYYTISFMIYSALNTATIAANSFMEERIKAGNMRILYSPISNTWLYLSKLISSFLFSTCLHIVVIIVLAMTFSLSFGTHPLLLIALLIALELFSSTIGILMCCILKSENSANQVISLLLNVLAILGGVFFSLDRFGSVLSMISSLSPIKWVTDAAFTIIYDNITISGYITIALLLLGTGICLWGCKRTFHAESCI